MLQNRERRHAEANREESWHSREGETASDRSEVTTIGERCILALNEKCWRKNIFAAYGNVADTQVERVFGGLLLQTIVCEECHHVSARLEPFFDLSLPITTVEVSLFWPFDVLLRWVRRVLSGALVTLGVSVRPNTYGMFNILTADVCRGRTVNHTTASGYWWR